MAEADAFLASRGIDLASMSAEDADQIRSMINLGDPDEIGEQFAARMAAGHRWFHGQRRRQRSY